MTILLRQFASRAIVPLAVVVAIAAPAYAADPGSEEELERVMQLMTERLSLSDDQAEAIRPRVKMHLDEMRDLFAGYRYGGAGSLPSLMQEFQELREHFQADLDLHLDDKQMAALMELRDEVDASIRETVVGYRIETMRDALGLSDEQVAAVTPILADAFDERRKLLSFHTSSAGGGARLQRNLGPEMAAVEASVESRLQEVLTMQQMELYREMVAEERDTLRKKEAGRQ